MVTEVSATELIDRAARTRLVLTDCDGVLTDQGVYYSAEGELYKRFNIRDGLGVARLREQNIACAIVTGERSPSVLRRAEKLGIVAFMGVDDKAAALDVIVTELGAPPEAVAYIGDDVNDLGVMKRIGAEGLTGAPADAIGTVRQRAHYITVARGGQGAFREFADWILGLRGGGTAKEDEP